MRLYNPRSFCYTCKKENGVMTEEEIRNYRETISLYMRQIVCNDLEFLRQWENDTNERFDEDACMELSHQAHITSLTITPSLWIRKTHAVGMYVKQAKGGGVSAYPEIAADFYLWLDPKARLAIVRARM